MDDSTLWAAVTSRNPSYDGKFLYAVRTTKIYCRPICKARVARRANVEFYFSAIEAEKAGYRACKRCKPELLTTFNPEAEKIERVCAMIRALPPNAPLPALGTMAAEAGLTKYHFHRLFRRETGVTPREFALASRAAKVGVDALSGTAGSMNGTLVTGNSTPITPDVIGVFDMAEIVGSGHALFDDRGFDPALLDDFAKVPIHSEFTDLPVIYYSTLDTTCGRLLVAFQDAQVSHVDIADDDGVLMAQMESIFPPSSFLHVSIDLAEHADVQRMRARINDVVFGLENMDVTSPSAGILDFASISPLPDVT